jgi:ketosteroid isomerase-like protein
MSNRLKLFVVIVALFAAPFQSLAAQPDSDPVRQVSDLREQWAKAWNENDLKALVVLYDEEAVLTPPTGERISGRENIQSYLTPIIKESSNLTFSNPKTDHSGKLVKDSGSFQHTITSPALKVSASKNALKLGASKNALKLGSGSSRQVEGNYVLVLKRESQGRLFIVEHALSDVPAAPQSK